MSTKDTERQVVPFLGGDQVPAHIAATAGSTAGNEGVAASDLTIPRLSLLQQLSPQLNKQKPEYVEEAETGMFFNNVTNECFERLYVCNLLYKKTVATFKKRIHGGGFGGNYATLQQAREGLIAQEYDPDQYDIVETANHYLLLLDHQGNIKQPAIMSMSGSKMRVSNQWNTKLLSYDCARFGTVWELSSIIQSKGKDTWHNVHVDFAGYAPEALYEAAAARYNDFRENGEDHTPESTTVKEEAA